MASKSEELFRGNLDKLQPKLRMIANGSDQVNAVRAELSAALRVESEELLKETGQCRGAGAVPIERKQMPKSVKRGSLPELPHQVSVNVFVQLEDPAARPGDFVSDEDAQRRDLIIATVNPREIPRLLDHPDVSWVEVGESLKQPTPKVGSASVRAPSVTERRFGTVSATPNVLIGIIDVEGFDFSHRDFLDADGNTRWAAIWDQAGDARPAPNRNPAHRYGAEFTREHLNAAIKAAPGLGVSAWEVEKQSQTAEGSHGTHVASIAAGNLGVCRNAVLAGVLIGLAPGDEDRRKSFYDSTRLAHAVDYLLELGQSMKLPVAINVSLGTNGHAHDGSAPVSRWIDAAMTTPGRAICVAAGNAGQERAETPDDIGFIVGRIHTSGRIPARDLVTDIDWVVAGNGLMDISENELELWYGPQDRFAVSVRPPGEEWTEIIHPREFIENRQLKDGSFLSIYNELYHPANGSNYISIFLSPLLSTQGIVGVRSGQWTVRLHGVEVRDGRFHAWIERDDPVRMGVTGNREAWRFPSFFSERSNVDSSSVTSLACGQRIISVGNLDSERARINITSSQGPTRDGRSKPDVAAPGTNIVAARGFSREPDKQWVSMSGTSMASPHVTGVVGLMLGQQPRLTAAQIEGIIRRTARPLPGADFNWVNDAGYGQIDPKACLDEVDMLFKRKDRTG
ncbi:MAG: S8 family serine peptidase [Dehalococcoidia bacterium]